jgi:GNAT superfamily N-acetyltransferase
VPALTCPLVGQDTLLNSWRALAHTSKDARIVEEDSLVAAVFPDWLPLNNAILLDEPDASTAAAAALRAAALYDEAGVPTWALWIPAHSTGFGSADRIEAIPGLRRDETTLVMHRELDGRLSEAGGLAEGDRVVRTSVASAGRAGDEPVPVHELTPPAPDDTMDAWVIVREGTAVVSAWSRIVGDDCGIYAVGTPPTWRRRGLARALLGHVLADAFDRGARTASLQSTPMGENLYAALGFIAAGRYEEWVPCASHESC